MGKEAIAPEQTKARYLYASEVCASLLPHVTSFDLPSCEFPAESERPFKPATVPTEPE